MENLFENAETKTNIKTARQVGKFFDECKAFWMRQGDSEKVAMCKAFWWDCVEVWNFDRCWNTAKAEFAKEFRNYRPGDPIPDEEEVKKGCV